MTTPPLPTDPAAGTPGLLDVAALRARGVDRVLCVVAHPDDMEYGASAAVSAWTRAGITVSYLLLTRGEAGIRDLHPDEVAPLRAEEQRRACARVGVEDLVIADLPDGLLEHTPATREVIARRIREVRPQMVLTASWELEVGWGINHVDHRVACLSVVDAIRDADNPWLYPGLAADGLAAWKASTLLVTGATTVTHLIPLDAEAVTAGTESLAAHRVYLEALPDHPAPEVIVGEGTAVADKFRPVVPAEYAHALAVRVLEV
ncbi:PIG-L deacetylase family protein [Brevibacterium litoralis]|uniref:PIG-L deacetylase family protein n=1 Tax=Brevibacterium litoralis TaxID=3138935 RepID=UPI0032EF7F1F